MKNKNLYRILVLVITFSILSSCKKGAEDPAFSFRTRKDRLAGSWRLKSGSMSITIEQTGQAAYKESYVFDGTTAIGNANQNGASVNVKGAYLLSIVFKKDGTFELIETVAGDVLSAKGKWNFLSGVGEAKNKEQVSLVIETISAGSSGAHFFSKFSTEFVYTLVMLKNKEMKIKTETKLYVNTKTGETDSYASEYTFVQ